MSTTNGTYLEPLHDRLFVRAIVDEGEQMIGSIIVPEQAKEQPTLATVVWVGDGSYTKDGVLKPLKVQPGDTVMHGKYSGSKMPFNGEDLIMLREADVMAIVRETDA